MSEEIITPANEPGSEMSRQQIIFWDGEGRIVPHLLYEYLGSIGIGNYFPDDSNIKNSDPILVRLDGNVVCPVNVGYLLDITKNYILECTKGSGKTGSILDSLHGKTSLFSDKNLKLLPTLQLEFISDTPDSGYYFFRNGVVKVTGVNIQRYNYDDFDQYLWEKSIIPIEFELIELPVLEQNCDFMQFFKDLTVVEDNEKTSVRFKALSSAVGYLLHRHKDPATTKSIILMDVYVNGQPNGGSGKTLLITAIGKIINLSVIDGKKFDKKDWFGLSSVEISTEVLLFDDVEKNFNLENLFSQISNGLLLKIKYKNNIYIPYEKAPKVAITTNYAINGTSSSYRRRIYEFEISATYSADCTPRDKFGRNFFDEWSNLDWNHFYNTMFSFLQVFLREGLVASDPINLQLTKLINRTCEEFVDWADQILQVSTQYDKKQLIDAFLRVNPEFTNRIKQREFTIWLRAWSESKNLKVIETHSDDVRFIKFVNQLEV